MSAERIKKLNTVLIALVTLAISGIALLQNDAAARNAQASRDFQRYGVETFGQQVVGEARLNFDMHSVTDAFDLYTLLENAARKVGDEAAARRYREVIEALRPASPLLSGQFGNPEEAVNPIPYVADLYVRAVTENQERFSAALAVKGRWGTKVNAYIAQLTLLAVALFLFGLSATLNLQRVQVAFTALGATIAVVALTWTTWTFTRPIFDLRDYESAIADYAEGQIALLSGEFDTSIAAFSRALSATDGQYGNAYLARGRAYFAKGDPLEAIVDLEKSLTFEGVPPQTQSVLAWAYYNAGQVEQAERVYRTGVERLPNEIWLRFDHGLSLMTLGRVQEGEAAYRIGMDQAIALVAKAAATSSAPPSELWDALDDAALQLDTLRDTIDGQPGIIPREKIGTPEAVRPAAVALSTQLKSLSVSLEYTGKPPAAPLSAQVTVLETGLPIYDDLDRITDATPAVNFPAGVSEVALQLEMMGMTPGAEILIKVFQNNGELTGYRALLTWAGGATGRLWHGLRASQNLEFALEAGLYRVQVYINGQLAGETAFTVGTA